MNRLKVVSAFMIGCLFIACSPSTRITGSWVDPTANSKFTSGTVFVASLTRNIEVRTKMETNIEDEVKSRNIKVVKGNNYFTPDFYQNLPNEKQLIRMIKSSGASTILTVSLTSKKSQNVPRGGGFYPYGGYYGFWGPSFWGPGSWGPGYMMRESVYYIESNLYDLRTNKIIWSAQSETVNPGSIEAFVKSYPKVLVGQMVKDGVLKV
jgi:hypothetical protein